MFSCCCWWNSLIVVIITQLWWNRSVKMQAFTTNLKRYIEICMKSSGALFMHSRVGDFGVYFGGLLRNSGNKHQNKIRVYHWLDLRSADDVTNTLRDFTIVRRACEKWYLTLCWVKCTFLLTDRQPNMPDETRSSLATLDLILSRYICHNIFFNQAYSVLRNDTNSKY